MADPIIVEVVPRTPVVVETQPGNATNARTASFVTEEGPTKDALNTTIADVAVLPAKVATGSALINDISEWWVEPSAMSNGSFTFKGAVGAPDESLPPYVGTQATFTAAPIILSEWRAGFPVHSVVAGYINADDHNVPAVVALPNRRRLAIWSGHYADNKTTWAVSDRAGSLESMSLAAGGSLTSTRTGLTAYAQVYLDATRSTESLSYYWLFQRVRRGTSPNYVHGWTVTEFTVNETVDFGGITLVSDSVSAGHGQRYFIRNADGLSYLAPATQDGNTIRFLWGPHPSGSGKLTLIDVDMQTGAITGSGLTGENIFFTPVDANEGAIADADLTFDYPDLPAGQRRRFFYRERDGFLRAQWTTGDEDNAQYLYAERVDDGFTGLRTTPTPGYASAAHRSAHTWTTTLEFGCFVKLPGSLAGATDVMRKFTSSATGSWYMRVNGSGQVLIAVSRTDTPTTPWTFTFSTAVTGLLGAADFVGLRVVIAENESGSSRARLYTTTDGGSTWTLHQANTAGTLYPFRKNGTDPITLGQGTVTSTLDFASAWVITDGVTTAVDVDFVDGWPIHTSAHTDTSGQAWTLTGNALVGGENVYVDHPMGTAGPRIGHGASANYIAGGCILINPDMSTRTVITVHREGDESVVRSWARTASGSWISSEVYRTADVLARPVAVRSVGPVRYFVSVIRVYGQGENEFTDYASDGFAFAI